MQITWGVFDQFWWHFSNSEKKTDGKIWLREFRGSSNLGGATIYVTSFEASVTLWRNTIQRLTSVSYNYTCCINILLSLNDYQEVCLSQLLPILKFYSVSIRFRTSWKIFSCKQVSIFSQVNMTPFLICVTIRLRAPLHDAAQIGTLMRCLPCH